MVVEYWYFNETDDLYHYKIKIDYEEDLKRYSKRIQNENFEMIYIKKKGIYIKSEYIKSVEYIENDNEDDVEKKILIRVSASEIFDICLNDEFDIISLDEIKSLEDRRDEEDYKIYKESISSEEIQNSSYRILKNCMSKNGNKVIYGKDAITNLENGTVKVVFVNWTFLKRTEEKIFSMLTKKENKYNNASIVVIGKGNDNYKEIKSYGGIIGVLY